MKDQDSAIMVSDMITWDSEHVKHSEGTIHIQVNLSVETLNTFHLENSHATLDYQRDPRTQPHQWRPIPSTKTYATLRTSISNTSTELG